jgi:cell wall-associated NlpC family hydrolase
MIFRTLLIGLLLVPITAAAQDGLFLTAGRVLAGRPDEASWRLTLQRDLIGPIGIDLGAQILPGERPQPGRLYGIEADITLFAGARRLPTIFFGGGAGIGAREQDQFWFSSSVGLRVPMLMLGPMRASIEGRWRMLSVANRDGFELGVTVGWRRPASRDAAPRGEAAGLWVPLATGDGLRASGIPAEKARLLGAVVSTALEEMGQPYTWGGTGDGSGGFDCSGLIYYAYGRHGLRIPRTSEGQARAGIAIRRDPDMLLPGDILTFAEAGDRITHVGLYVGDGRFIHSASKGVRVSRLSEDDPDGRWWLRRWVGVRRVVE